MQLRFTKMHGLGNDFMVIDAISQKVRLTPELVRQLSDRNTGVGFDQLLLVEAPSEPDMDFRYRIYNADGSEVEHCGNGARCFAKFVREKGLVLRDTIFVQTARGKAVLKLTGRDLVEVDMGPPDLEPAEIPLQAEQQAAVYRVELEGYGEIELGAVSMGNPHAVVLVDSVDSAPVAELGPILESHKRFPNRANVGFMQIVNRNEIRLRVFERGAGETQACGTGACAAVVSGVLRGLLDADVRVRLLGGDLQIRWDGQDSSVMMTGPVASVYEGQIFL